MDGAAVTAPKGDAALSRVEAIRALLGAISWDVKIAALRAALAAKEQECERLRYKAESTLTSLLAAEARADRLAALVESAPHSSLCDLIFYDQNTRIGGYPCTCWKARALDAGRKEGK